MNQSEGARQKVGGKKEEKRATELERDKGKGSNGSRDASGGDESRRGG